MPLQSKLFKGDQKLEAAAVADSAHITPGTRGLHVGKIQRALFVLEKLKINHDEISATIYGTSTANAVLTYKRKRAIINRSYQSSADNIVGKMTIAALDREVAIAEVVVRKTPVFIPIAPPPRPVGLDFFTQSRRSATSLQALTPVSSRSSLASLNLFGAVPILPHKQVEIEVGDVGTVKIIDGKGEIVFIENLQIGLLIDPTDKSEKGQLDINSDSETFSVRGKSQGSTRILATKHEGFFNNAGLVSLALVVNPASPEKLWRPTFSANPIGKMHAEVFASHEFGPPELGVRLQSATFEFVGNVDPINAVQQRSNFDFGILQTVVTSTFIATYTSADGKVWTLNIMGPTVASRDAADASPFWYHKDAVKQLTLSGVDTIKSNDTPHTVVPWQTKDKKGSLVSTTGLDVYNTYLAVRNRTTSELTVLAFAEWTVSWSGTFDFEKNTTSLPIGSNLGPKGNGSGSISPVTSGRTCVEQIRKFWTGPQGGF